jgi:Zn-finger protein
MQRLAVEKGVVGEKDGEEIWLCGPCAVLHPATCYDTVILIPSGVISKHYSFISCPILNMEANETVLL